MMHTMWKGAISFGLVNIPIRMYAATEEKSVRFKYLHQPCHTPIRYVKTCPSCNTPVEQEQIVRGYEVEPGRFVLVEEEELENLLPESRKSIEILDFVDLEEIDPIYFIKSYYLSPQETGEKAYQLLLTAMQDTRKVAISKFTLRNKTSLAVLRVYQRALLLETIFYPDEVRPLSQLPGLPAGESVQEKELEIAKQLIDNLSQPFDPAKYTDDYRTALLEMIEKKRAGQKVHEVVPAPKGEIIDLMEALQASLEATQPKPKRKAKSRKKATTAG